MIRPSDTDGPLIHGGKENGLHHIDTSKLPLSLSYGFYGAKRMLGLLSLHRMRP